MLFAKNPWVDQYKAKFGSKSMPIMTLIATKAFNSARLTP